MMASDASRTADHQPQGIDVLHNIDSVDTGTENIRSDTSATSGCRDDRDASQKLSKMVVALYVSDFAWNSPLYRVEHMVFGLFAGIGVILRANNLADTAR